MSGNIKLDQQVTSAAVSDEAALDLSKAEHVSSHELSDEQVLGRLCHMFNQSPYLILNKMKMVVENGSIQCVLPMSDQLIGNTSFKILHGGVTATLLDSIGGIVALAEIYKRTPTEQMADMLKRIHRLATVDMRVDYISPGRGSAFVGTAEVLRVGKKGCTVRMNMHSNLGKLVATGMATYAY